MKADVFTIVHPPVKPVQQSVELLIGIALTKFLFAVLNVVLKIISGALAHQFGRSSQKSVASSYCDSLLVPAEAPGLQHSCDPCALSVMLCCTEVHTATDGTAPPCRTQPSGTNFQVVNKPEWKN